MPYTQQNDMGGFFHFISHAAFKGAKIGVGAGEGFITGGPEGALRGGATAALQRGPQHGSQNAQSPAATQQARAIAAARHTAEHRAAMQRRAARRAEEFRYGMSEYEFSQPLPARFAGGYPHVAGTCAPGIAHSSYGYGMGDASGGLPDWGSFSPTQKVLAGLAAAALLVVVTK